MKRKAILVVAIMMIMPGANAAGIRSAAGQSQSAWNASVEYQNFQCPAGTSRGEGVDMNFTTDRSDDYHFVECNPIVISTPAPITQTTTTQTSNTESKTDTLTVVSTGTTNSTTSTITSISSQNTETNTVTTIVKEISKTIVDYSKFDWTTTDWTTFDWEDFFVWLTAYIDQLLTVKP